MNCLPAFLVCLWAGFLLADNQPRRWTHPPRPIDLWHSITSNLTPEALFGDAAMVPGQPYMYLACARSALNTLRLTKYRAGAVACV